MARSTWWVGLDRQAFVRTLGQRERERARRDHAAVRAFMQTHPVPRVTVDVQPEHSQTDVWIQGVGGRA
jgi:hypothetical protein